MGSSISHWLTTFPLEYYHFDLAPTSYMPWPCGIFTHHLVFLVGMMVVERVLACSMVLSALKVVL